MRDSIPEDYSTQILKEMFKRVGADYESFNFSQKNWFWSHSWSKEQEEDFRKWLGGFLVANKLVRKGKYRGQDNGYYQAGKLLSNYGWKLKNGKTLD